MFFNISKTINNDFPEHVAYGGYSIDLDPGWKITHNGDNITISKGLYESSCTIRCSNNKISISPGNRRTFPIFYNDTEISNIVNYEHGYFQKEELILNDIVLEKSQDSIEFIDLKLSDNEVFECLYDYLDEKIKNFNPLETIDIFPTGGIDTMLVLSFMIKHKKRYSIVTAEHKDQDYFICHNRSRLNNFWAYKNIIYWREPHILASGTNGDEMMLRNPDDAFLIGLCHNENIREIVKTEDHYHSVYFQKKFKPLTINITGTLITDYKNHILSRNYYDYQFWHLGNTLTWTPLNDIKICNIMLNFSYKTLRGQILDASISKQLIERNDPNLLRYVSDSKNENGFKKIYKIFEGTESFS